MRRFQTETGRCTKQVVLTPYMGSTRTVSLAGLEAIITSMNAACPDLRQELIKLGEEDQAEIRAHYQKLKELDSEEKKNS